MVDLGNHKYDCGDHTTFTIPSCQAYGNATRYHGVSIAWQMVTATIICKASSNSRWQRYPTLGGASSITTTTIGESTYALVASRDDNGVQIIRLFSPTLSIIANNANPVYV